jgi:transcription antitermination factor NusG
VIDTPDQWIVAVLQTGGFRRAEENLLRQHFHFYNPKYRTSRIIRGALRWVELQLFPGYLFVHSACPVRSIRGTRGIADVVHMAGTPIPVSDELLDVVRRREDHDGFVLMEKPVERFKKGDKLKIDGDQSNPMIDVDLFYECTSTRGRVKVLMSLLGRMVSTEIREDALVAA